MLLLKASRLILLFYLFPVFVFVRLSVPDPSGKIDENRSHQCLWSRACRISITGPERGYRAEAGFSQAQIIIFMTPDQQRGYPFLPEAVRN